MSFPRENTLRVSSPLETNKAAVVEIPNAGNSLRIRLRRILYGYGSGGTLSGGKITIEDGVVNPAKDGEAEPNLEIPVSSNGAGWLPLDYQAKAETPVKVTLAAGGTGVTGSITLIYTVE